jgi:hypothetical protein
VHEIDLEQGRVVDSHVFEASEDETVYGVNLLPDEFSAPPKLQDGHEYAFWQRATLPTGVTPIPV